jgi:hypothetical protein
MTLWHHILSDSDKASFGRIGACVILITWLITCVILTYIDRKPSDIPIQWAGLAAVLFGVSKGGDVIKAALTKPVPIKEEEDV